MSEGHTLFFTKNDIFECAGYLVTRRLAFSSAQCFFRKDISGYKASNQFIHDPEKKFPLPKKGKSRPYFTTSTNVLTSDSNLILTK